MLMRGLIFTYSLNVTISGWTKDKRWTAPLPISSSCHAVNLVFELIRPRLHLVTGGGPSGAAPEQTALLHNVRVAQGAAAALLPPGLLGGGGGGGDQPSHGGQLADAARQLRGKTNTDRQCVCVQGCMWLLLITSIDVFLF